MTKQKQNFRNFCELVKKEKLKYHIEINIQTRCTVHSWSIFRGDYSLRSSWGWCNKLCTPGFGDCLPFFSADPFKLHQLGWGLLLDGHLQVSPETLCLVQPTALAGSLNDIHRIFLKPFCFHFVMVYVCKFRLMREFLFFF